jgi:hypothetical protein
MLKWLDRLDTSLACAWLGRWPTLEKLQKVSPAKLRSFFYRHHSRQRELIERRIREIAEARPALNDRAIVQVQAAVVPLLVELVEKLRQGIQQLDAQIAQAAAKHPDYYLFEVLPGAGEVLAPRLLAAVGSQRERYQSASELQTFCGIAPVMECSGKKRWVHSRWRCPKFLRQSFHEWAGHSVAFSAWARAYYQQQRQRGQGHHAAVRSLAFKWIRILFRCWKDRVVYDEGLYTAKLARRGSPLARTLACAEPVKS